MLWKIISVACFVALLVKADMKSDVDVFNKNYNKNQRNARDYLLRSFDIVPSNYVSLFGYPLNLITTQMLESKKFLKF